MVSMMTYFFSARGFGHPVFLKPHFGHPVMKILAKTLCSQGFIYFLGFLPYFVLAKLDTCSIRVNFSLKMGPTNKIFLLSLRTTSFIDHLMFSSGWSALVVLIVINHFITSK